MNSETIIQEFYTQLADKYHLLFDDFEKIIEGEVSILKRLLKDHGITPPARLLDCACGIGTQTLGLAARGFKVHASDLNAAVVERLTEEATRRNLDVDVEVADFRNLSVPEQQRYDATICCDNALAHMLTEDDLSQALSSIAETVRPGGCVVTSVRDYDEIRTQKFTATRPLVYVNNQSRRTVFQTWDWADSGDIYTVHMYLLEEDESGIETQRFDTIGRAIGRSEITKAMTEAGLSQIRWIEPENTGYHQPIVVGTK